MLSCFQRVHPVCLPTPGPAAALATGSWLWSLVSPSSHVVCSAVVALMAVAADYNSLGREVARGKIPPGGHPYAAGVLRGCNIGQCI
jgi:hypothetical protein